jgi:hypothetical protein
VGDLRRKHPKRYWHMTPQLSQYLNDCCVEKGSDYSGNSLGIQDLRGSCFQAAHFHTARGMYPCLLIYSLTSISRKKHLQFSQAKHADPRQLQPQSPWLWACWHRTMARSTWREVAGKVGSRRDGCALNPSGRQH